MQSTEAIVSPHQRIRTFQEWTGHTWIDMKELRDELKLPKLSRDWQDWQCDLFRNLCFADWAAAEYGGETYPREAELTKQIHEQGWPSDDAGLWRCWQEHMQLSEEF